ncbi:ras-related protein Ral-A isoform X1 [Ursus arctos]|uniref:ras-related protein Ral-A isoform X1 n=1 Tax=Ursus arctos TaxID=9644 RepID=UPI002548EFF0|nr:ras-related protein Ral-A isoform X1 [Ursus arctos]
MAASAFPSFPENPLLVPRKRQGRRGADAEIREPPRGLRQRPDPGRRLHLARREEPWVGLSIGQCSQLTARSGWTPPSPRTRGYCSPASAPNTLLSAHGQEVAPQPAPPRSPSAPEVICGGCCRAARRRVDLRRAERPESSSSSCRPGSAAARRTRPSAARGGEPPRRQGPSAFRPKPAQPRLPEPAGRRTGLRCRERQPAREGTQAGGVGEEEADSQPSREPYAGLDPRTLGSHPGPKADA